MNRDAFKLGFTLDEFTAEVNRDSRFQYTNQQTEPFWSTGISPGQARDKLAESSDDRLAQSPLLNLPN